MNDVKEKEIKELIKKAREIKKNPKKYQKKVFEKVLFTFFAAPSLRTELSFDSAMFQMGGEVIDYHAETSPWSKGKESIEDVARVVSRYCDIMMIRMYDHKAIEIIAKNASIPVINGLSDVEHPCQALSDLMTMQEVCGKKKGLKVAYLGDSRNNVTHSLMLGCAMSGINIVIGCPKEKKFSPMTQVLAQARKYAKKNKSKVVVIHDPEKAVKDADVVYTDSWMSYNINPAEKSSRMKALKRYQVNKELMKHAKKSAVFMHCLPAVRGMEVTKDVIDGKQSVVFDQAENRLHMQKALILKLLN